MAGNLIKLVMVNYGCGNRHNWGWVSGVVDQLDWIVRGEDSVVRRPSRCFRNPAVPGWSPTLATC